MTSMLSLTPAVKRSRACVSVWVARSRLSCATAIWSAVLPLFQCGLGADHISGNATAVKQIDFGGSHKGKRAMGIVERGTDVTVIGGDSGSGITLAARGLHVVLRGTHPGLAAFIIRALRQRRHQCLILRHRCEGRKGRGFRQIEFLAVGKSDHPAENELALVAL